MLRMALILPAFAFLATPVFAASYSAKPAVPVSQRIIARDIVWNCGPAACQGSTDESRPVVLCQSLAKQAGRIDSFIVDGREFSAAELSQCNALAAKARPMAVKALAAQ